jgi:hypothetical protein
MAVASSTPTMHERGASDTFQRAVTAAPGLFQLEASWRRPASTREAPECRVIRASIRDG